MATKTDLTPRQAQIQKLLDQGKTPAEIAHALDVTTNNIYQHLKRMKKGTTSRAKPRKARSTTSGRKRASRDTFAVSPAATKGIGAVLVPNMAGEMLKPHTPLQVIRDRKDEIETRVKNSAAKVAADEKTYLTSKEVHEKFVAKNKEELRRLEIAERALQGKILSRAAAKPRSRAAAPPATENAHPDAAPEPKPEVAIVTIPVVSNGSQAVAQDESAEFSQEGVDEFVGA